MFNTTDTCSMNEISSQEAPAKMESLEGESSAGDERGRFLELCVEFAEMTTAHGIPNVINTKSRIWRSVWSVIIVAVSILFLVQVYQLASDFHSFHTNVHLIHSESVEFPVITLCNFNMLRLSKLTQNEKLQNYTRYSDFWKSGDKLQDYYWLWSSNDWFNDYYSSSEGNISERKKRITRELNSYYPWSSQNIWSSNYWFYDDFWWDYSSSSTTSNNFKQFEHIADNTWDLVKKENLTKSELRDMGHQAKDFILQCKFNKKECDASNFTSFQNKEYGNCFSFNVNRSTRNERRISKAGSNYGLHLTLFIEYPEYIFTAESGVRLLIHPQGSFPHPEEVGISLSPGFATSIGIRQVELQRLKHPYGDCTDAHVRTGPKINLSSKYEYGIVTCQKMCREAHLIADCKCVDNVYHDDPNLPWCIGKAFEKCVQKIDKNYHTGKLECDCPAPCHETVYNTQVSASSWPVERFADTLRKQLNESRNFSEYSDKLRAVWESISVTRKNLVRVKVYFEELNYQLIEQVPSNSIPSFLGALGGLLGLCLGFSLITITEISIFVSKLIALLVKVYRR